MSNKWDELSVIVRYICTGLTPLKHEYHYTGQLTVPEPSTPGRMEVRFPLSKCLNVHNIIII